MTSSVLNHDTQSARLDAESDVVADVRQQLQHCLGVAFSIWHAESGDLISPAADWQIANELLVGELVRATGRQTAPRLIVDEDSVVMLALPIEPKRRERLVAVAPFATRRIEADESLDGAAGLLGLDLFSARQWIERQLLWTTDSLLRVGQLALDKFTTDERIRCLEREIESVSDNLSSTYEEISLLYSVTQNLRISNSETELGELALKWLSECVPARGLSIQYLPVAGEGEVTYNARTQTSFLQCGECPLDEASFSALIAHLGLRADSRPLVANRKVTHRGDWPAGGVDELIVVPLSEGNRVFGWLAAFNHDGGDEFGTVEANLLNSVATILGIHGGNLDLYRQQDEFLATVVRALTSSIDAKDPYTCGHSDRVARVSVLLARELGADIETLNTIYMAGLLHDIGKIGIEDGVLRKPGRLTDEEFEQIKRHPELGYNILADLKPLAGVLPAVLHHHEQWNGGGYPHGLAGLDIPESARIVAVADSWDAMTSDRPYRNGMPAEKVDSILRDGAGSQWDARIVDSFFRIRDQISCIRSDKRANLSLDVGQWTA